MAKDNIIRLNTSRYSVSPSPEERAIDDIAQRLEKLEREVGRIQRKNESPRLPKSENEKKNILLLRQSNTESSEPRRMMKKASRITAPSIKVAPQTVLNATARRLLSATCHGTIFVTFHSYQIPSMYTLTEELREEERTGGFSSNDPADDTFMADAPLPAVKAEPAQPPAIAPTINVTKLREPQPASALPHAPAPLAPEVEVQREGLKWVRILVLSGISIIFAMMILAWFLASRNSMPVEAKHVVQFSPAEPPPPQVAQQPSPTVQEAHPAVAATNKQNGTSDVAANEGRSHSYDNGSRETVTPSENVLEKMVIDGHYEIQALATPRRTEAEQMVASLKARGANAFVSATVRNNIDFFRVRIGNYANERQARSEANRLGLHAAWVEKVQ